MPYRNIEENRKYQREWSRRKKAGIPTRMKPKLTEEERMKNKKSREKRYRLKRKKLLIELFGNKCFFCNFVPKEGYWSLIHNKKGEKHKLMGEMSLKKIKSLKKDEYIRLCGRCHGRVHWCMKYLGMNWEEIEKRYDRTIENKEGIVPNKGSV